MTVSSDLKATQVDSAVGERQAVVAALSANASIINYWVSESDGWHVVTTVDTVLPGSVDQGDHHAIVRFSTTILPGETQTISVPGPSGSPPHEMRIRRLGDHIEVVAAGAGRPDD
jgi:hypothetical protein